MKESIGGTYIFIIVVTLVLLFSAIMSLTMNRSNAFAVKDRIISIIEDYGYFEMNSQVSKNNEVLNAIVDSLKDSQYRQSGICPDYNSDSDKIKMTAYNRDGTIATSDNAASFCITRVDATLPGGVPAYYYEVTFFYNLDIPLLKEVFNFKVKGQTKALQA